MHAILILFSRFCSSLGQRCQRGVRRASDLRYGRAGALAAHVIRFMS